MINDEFIKWVMLLLGLSLLVFLIPFQWKMFHSYTRIMIIIFLYSALLYTNSMLNITYSNESGIGIYNGLWVIQEINSGGQSPAISSLGIIILILLLASTLLLSPLKVGTSLTEDINNEKGLTGYNSHKSWAILSMSVLGMITVISASNLGTLFLGIELQSYTLYILSSLNQSESAKSAGLKYFFLGAFSSGFILLGCSLLYGLTGLTHIESISLIMPSEVTYELNSHWNIWYNSISGNYSNLTSQGFIIASQLSISLLLIGLLMKIASVPFHNWAPDVYDGVPTIITSWIAIFPKLSIFLVIYQISQWNGVTYILFICSILSLIFGSILGLSQYRIKRLLAYSGISHIGFILISIICLNSHTLIYYLIQYTLTTINIFYILIGLNIELISQFRTCTNQLLAISLTISLLSLAGIPPFIGFIAKLNVLNNALDQNYYFLSLIAILTSIISCAYYLKIIRVIYFESRIPDSVIQLLSKSSISNIDNTHSTFQSRIPHIFNSDGSPRIIQASQANFIALITWLIIWIPMIS